MNAKIERKSFIERNGRKFSLSLIAMVLGAVVAVFGIVMAARAPEAAPSIAGMVTALSGIFAVAAGGFNLSNAYVSGKMGPEQKSSVTQTTEITQTGGTPPQEPQ